MRNISHKVTLLLCPAAGVRQQLSFLHLFRIASWSSFHGAITNPLGRRTCRPRCAGAVGFAALQSRSPPPYPKNTHTAAHQHCAHRNANRFHPPTSATTPSHLSGLPPASALYFSSMPSPTPPLNTTIYATAPPTSSQPSHDTLQPHSATTSSNN